MIKTFKQVRLEYLEDLQGTLLKLFEYSTDDSEQEWLQSFSEKLEKKIQKLKGDKL